MEEAVRKALGSQVLKDTGIGGGGCISVGSTYLTDTNPVFIKVNHEAKAKEMFIGEKAGLKAILATKTIRVPKPICVVPFGSTSCALVMENMSMKYLNSRSQWKLGENLANLHNHNKLLVTRSEKDTDNVTSPSKRVEDDDERILEPAKHSWTTFFIRQKLEFQVNELLQKGRDEELVDAWDPCMHKVQAILNEINPIPSLLHGDLWSGNASSESSTDEPIVYDPAAFYGHSEYDLGIAHMFGGFSKEFYDAYHKILPKEEGFHKRLQVYELFHHLNHCVKLLIEQWYWSNRNR